MSRRDRLITKPNAGRALDGLTVGQFDVLKSACEDAEGDVYIVSSSGRPRIMIDKGWLKKAPCKGYRVFRVTAAGRQRYADALSKSQEAQRSKPAQRVCDLCGRTYRGPHVDPVSGKPRHPDCVPF
jgi:hypothetical protein